MVRDVNDMTRLQRNAWIELAAVTFCIPVAGAVLANMVRLNAKGLYMIVYCIVPVCIVVLVSYLQELRSMKKYDERERKIRQKSILISCHVVISFLVITSFVIFFIFGGKSFVPVYYLPGLMLWSIFIGQFVQSAIILIQSAKEDSCGE